MKDPAYRISIYANSEQDGDNRWVVEWEQPIRRKRKFFQANNLQGVPEACRLAMQDHIDEIYDNGQRNET